MKKINRARGRKKKKRREENRRGYKYVEVGERKRERKIASGRDTSGRSWVHIGRQEGIRDRVYAK